MKKVIIEVTEKGWTTSVHLDGNIFTQNVQSTRYGAKGDKNFGDHIGISDDLLDALDNFAFYDIMNALKKNNM
ncbi:MAG: hypothetical protein ACOYOV_17490 [Bacteroidales bacterium]